MVQTREARTTVGREDDPFQVNEREKKRTERAQRKTRHREQKAEDKRQQKTENRQKTEKTEYRQDLEATEPVAPKRPSVIDLDFVSFCSYFVRVLSVSQFMN